MEERVFFEPSVKEVLKRFVCVRLDGRESNENRALKLEYGPVVMGNVQNRIVSPFGENLARLPTNFDTPRLVAYLARWRALYPGRDEPPPEEWPLPYFASLHQALNVAACDARVLVVVMDCAAKSESESLIKVLAWDAEFSGRFHFVRARENDEALRSLRESGSTNDGAYLVIPDEFGMSGEVSARVEPDMTREEVVSLARSVLRAHVRGFKPRTVVEKFQRHVQSNEAAWFYPPDNGSNLTEGTNDGDRR